MDWHSALQRPGVNQMRHVRALMESRPWLERVPDQELIVDNYKGSNRMRATRGCDYAFIYCPNGLKAKVRMGLISGDAVAVSWFNPRTGEFTAIETFANTEVAEFIPPTSGRGEDWVLVLDDAAVQRPL